MEERLLERSQVVRLVVVTVAGVALVAGLALFRPGVGSGSGVARAAAVQTVFDSYPAFTGISERNPGAIGQADYWTAERAGDRWTVTIRRGWNDCQAGCVSEHRWVFTVADGTATLTAETGDPLP